VNCFPLRSLCYLLFNLLFRRLVTLTSEVHSKGVDQPGRVWPLLLLLVLAAATLVAIQWRRPRAPDPWVGLSLPAIEAAGWLNSDKPLSIDDLRGKVVLLDFWSTDCPTCVLDTPDLVELHKRFADDGLVVVGLTFEPPTELQRVREYVEEANIKWPIGYGAGFIFQMMDIQGTPTYVLYDRKGRSVWGGHSLDGVEDAAVAALAKK
jgi:thiol-disulfide isomerase/thioredoxin